MVRRVSFLLTFLAICSVPVRGDIRATVMTIDGRPIADARVVLLEPELPAERLARLRQADPTPKVLAETTSDKRGNITIAPPKGTGVATIQFEGKGYGVYRNLVLDGEDLGAVVLSAAKPIEGRLTLGGKPADGAVLSWRNTSGAEIVVKSDAHGVYRVPDPRAWGVVERTVVHPDAAVNRQIQVIGTWPMNVTLKRGDSVSGTVVAEDGKTPVAGATILVDGWPLGTSAEDGNWTITHVPDDWKTIEIENASRGGLLTRGSKENKVVVGRPATLTGTLIDGRSNRPVSGALVILSRGRRDGGRDMARTDAKGGFSFEHVSPGNYQVSITHPAYAAEPARVAIKPGVASSRNLVATATATISGSVIDEAKTAVPAGRISTIARDQGRRPFAFMLERAEAFSAPDGRFVLRGVAPDQPFDIDVDKKGLPPTKKGPFTLAPAQTKTGVLIELPTGFRVSGKVLDEEGVPLPGVAVTAGESDSGPMNRRVIRGMVRRLEQADEDLIKTDEKGEFAMQLREGKYDLSFRGEGFAPKRVNSVEARAGTEPIEVTLEPGVTLEGRVVKSDGTGVPDVVISVVAGGAPQDAVNTSANGEFVVPDLSPGTVMVIAVKPEAYIQEMRSTKVPGDDLVIEIPPRGQIDGRVVDKSSGAPIVDFEVGPSGGFGGGGIRIAMPGSPKTIHADDGHFLLEEVPAGEASLVVNAPGYLQKTVHGLKVVEGETLENVEVTLEKGVKLTGNVTGPDGSPLQGTRVTPTSDDGGDDPIRAMLRGGGAAVTDAAGDYTIEAVEPGEQTVTFEHDGYLPEKKSATLEGAETRLDARLSRGREVRGSVVDATGQPVPGAQVRARSSAQDSGSNSTDTDNGGQFVFEGLVPGRYTFSASKSGYLDAERPDVDIDTSGPINLMLGQGGAISGRVIGLDANEYSSVTVIAQGADSRQTTSVSSSGSFRMEGAPTGSVRVSAAVRSMFESRTTPTKTVEVSPGSEAQVDLEFETDTVIRGRVTRDGKPVETAVVNFVPSDRRVETRGSTSTDSNGEYEVTGLADGNYDVAVLELQGFKPYDTKYEVRGSGTFDIDIRSAVLSGRIVDVESGDPIADATVQIEAAEGGAISRRMVMLTAKQTGSAGEFEFADLAEGDYHVRADAKGYGNVVEDVSLSEGANREVEIRLLQNDGALLRIIDARDGRSLSASVLIRDGQGRTVYQGRPSPRADGTLRVDVAPGSYRSSIFADGYAPATLTLTSPASAAATIAMSPGGTVEIESRESTVRTGRFVGPAGEPFIRGPWNPQGDFGVNPGLTRIDNVPPGPWTLQLLDAQGGVEKTVPVVVQEGQVTRVAP